MTVSRATLPQAFQDVLSAKLLVAPDYQMLHGTLAKMAMNAALSNGQMGISADRAIPSMGQGLLSLEQQRLALADPIKTEAIVSVAELGNAGVGHTVRLNRQVFQTTTYTQASRQVTAGQVISTTPADITAEQVSITLKRFAGPYDQTNSRIAPRSVDQLDAMRSQQSLYDYVSKDIKRDFEFFLDQVTVKLFDAASSSVYASGFAADNDITAAGTAPLTVAQLWNAKKTLELANAPKFVNGVYIGVFTPEQEVDLKNDSAFQRLAVFDKNINPLLASSYIGSIAGVECYVSNSLTRSSNSSSVSVQYGQVFGPGMVGMGLGAPPMVRSSTDDNFGLQAKIIWELCAGFATLDNRLGVSVRTG